MEEEAPDRRMTRWAIVLDDKQYVVVPESQIGNRKVHCSYLGHREGAWKLADSLTKAEYGRGYFGPRGKKAPPTLPDEGDDFVLLGAPQDS